MMEVVAALCALTSLACAGLLARAWAANRVPLLFWCLLCFAGLALNNVMLLVDELSDASLVGWRQLPAAIGVAALCFGLVFSTGRR